MSPRSVSFETTSLKLTLQIIEQMPESLLDDVLIFVRSLKAQKRQMDLETCLLSEGALAQDRVIQQLQVHGYDEWLNQI